MNKILRFLKEKTKKRITYKMYHKGNLVRTRTITMGIFEDQKKFEKRLQNLESDILKGNKYSVIVRSKEI